MVLFEKATACVNKTDYEHTHTHLYAWCTIYPIGGVRELGLPTRKFQPVRVKCYPILQNEYTELK